MDPHSWGFTGSQMIAVRMEGLSELKHTLKKVSCQFIFQLFLSGMSFSLQRSLYLIKLQVWAAACPTGLACAAAAVLPFA